MKIYITTSFGSGRTYDFDIDSSIKIQKLKARLPDKIGGYNSKTMCLVFDGEMLDDDDAVSDFEIKDGSILELVNPNANYRSQTGFFGLKFVDVSIGKGLKRIEWSKTAKQWRRARHGLCLEGQCKNSKCEAHGHTVIMPIGYRKFDMSSDPSETTTKCPVCSKYVQPETCGFNNCFWRYDGTKDCGNGPPQSCSSGWERADDAYHRFDEQQSGIIVWRRLIFEAVNKNPSDKLGESVKHPGGLETSEGASEESVSSEAWQSSATSTTSPMSLDEFQYFSLSYITISKSIKMNIDLFLSRNESVRLLQRSSLTSFYVS